MNTLEKIAQSLKSKVIPTLVGSAMLFNTACTSNPNQYGSNNTASKPAHSQSISPAFKSELNSTNLGVQTSLSSSQKGVHQNYSSTKQTLQKSISSAQKNVQPQVQYSTAKAPQKNVQQAPSQIPAPKEEKTIEAKVKHLVFNKNDPTGKIHHGIGTLTYSKDGKTLYHNVGKSLQGFVGNDSNTEYFFKGIGKVVGNFNNGVTSYSVDKLVQNGFDIKHPGKSYFMASKDCGDTKISGASVLVKYANFSDGCKTPAKAHYAPKHKAHAKPLPCAKDQTSSVVQKPDETSISPTYTKVKLDDIPNVKIVSSEKDWNKEMMNYMKNRNPVFKIDKIEQIAPVISSEDPCLDLDVKTRNGLIWKTDAYTGNLQDTYKKVGESGVSSPVKFTGDITATHKKGQAVYLRPVSEAGKPLEERITIGQYVSTETNPETYQTTTIVQDFKPINTKDAKDYKTVTQNISGQKIEAYHLNGGSWLGIGHSSKQYTVELENRICGTVEAERSLAASAIKTTIYAGILATGIYAVSGGAGGAAAPAAPAGGNVGQIFGNPISTTTFLP